MTVIDITDAAHPSMIGDPIPVGNAPLGVAVTPVNEDLTYAIYVANDNPYGSDNTVTAIAVGPVTN